MKKFYKVMAQHVMYDYRDAICGWKQVPLNKYSFLTIGGANACRRLAFMKDSERFEDGEERLVIWDMEKHVEVEVLVEDRRPTMALLSETDEICF